MFLIIFSHFKDQKTPLMMTILSLRYFFLIICMNLLMANWPPPMKKRWNDKGEKVSIREVILTPYRPEIFHVGPSHVR